MKTNCYAVIRYLKAICLSLALLLSFSSFAQTASCKSLLINHGSTCSSTTPEQDFFGAALSSNPTMVSSGSIGVPFYNVLAAYNPEDHKVYYAQMDAANNKTNIYAVDYNFSGNITHPALSTPTYTYNYALNQLCFDNNGVNYVFSKFDKKGGKATLNRVDIATGNEMPGSNVQITFPSANIPTDLDNGDVIVLPNDRMFVTFGTSPSKLYEINIANGANKGTATFLANLPRVCFSIAYIDGNLCVSGADTNGCYYYIWDINSYTLSAAFPLPFGKTSADMTNMTLAIGCSNKLAGSTSLPSNKANIIYEVTVRNLGNIFLSSTQLTDNLATTYGKGNISNLQIVTVSNPANLLLNPSYDGVNDTTLLKPGQTLNNYPDGKDSMIIRIQFTASNLVSGRVYYNSALAYGQIGAGVNFLSVTDSSSNGDARTMDKDNNGVSGDGTENSPTPYVFSSLLPISELNLKGTLSSNTAGLNWETSLEEVRTYEVQRSADGYNFQSVTIITPTAKNVYAFTDNISQLKQNQYYYRIKVVKTNDNILYSNIVLLKSTNLSSTFSVFPNPFPTKISVQGYAVAKGSADLSLLDVTGRVLLHNTYPLEAGNNFFTLAETATLKPGIYWLKLNTGSGQQVLKVVKQ